MDKTSAAVLAGTAVIAAQLIGRRQSPSPDHPRTAAWYASLRKPSFTPPGPVFAVAWTGLDALLGYSGYRLLTARPSPYRGAALSTWGLNLLGVAGFSWVFFGRKRLDEALGVTVGMAVTSAAGAATARAASTPTPPAASPRGPSTRSPSRCSTPWATPATGCARRAGASSPTLAPL